MSPLDPHFNSPCGFFILKLSTAHSWPWEKHKRYKSDLYSQAVLFRSVASFHGFCDSEIFRTWISVSAMRSAQCSLPERVAKPWFTALKTFVSCYRTPGPWNWLLSPGKLNASSTSTPSWKVFAGFLKAFWKGFEGSFGWPLQEPFKTLQRPLQRPFWGPRVL